MNSIKKLAIRRFAMSIAISFFFTSIFIVIGYFFLEERISKYINFINTLSIRTNNVEDKEIVYNTVTKRLINYPAYGKKYANLKIQSINIDLPVYYGDSMKILKNGVGQYAGSYFPGEGGTTVLAAHNSSDYFQRLVDIKIGDLVTIETSYGVFNYRVKSFKVVHMSDEDSFKIRDDAEELLMYTCYPVTRSIVGRRTQRFLVFASRVSGEDEET